LTQIKWLQAFTKLNKIACQKVLLKMTKNFMELPANVLDKVLLNETKKLPFWTFQSDLNELKQDILQFYAEKFTNGDVSKAEEIIGIRQEYVAPRELGWLAFLGGTLVVFFVLIVYLIFIPEPSKTV
jgi:hypothetical protein